MNRDSPGVTMMDCLYAFEVLFAPTVKPDLFQGTQNKPRTKLGNLCQ